MEENQPDSTTDNAKYIKKKGDIEIEAIDPIQDVMSEKEIQAAHDRISKMLED